MRKWFARTEVGNAALILAGVALAVSAARAWGLVRLSDYVPAGGALIALWAAVINWAGAPATERQASVKTAEAKRDERLRALADWLRGTAAGMHTASGWPGELNQWPPNDIAAYLRGTRLPPWPFISALLRAGARRSHWSPETRAGYEREARALLGAALGAAEDAALASGLADAGEPGEPRQALFRLRSRRVVVGGVTAVAAIGLAGYGYASRPSPAPAPPPAYAWTRQTGGAVQSSPCVMGGTVFAASNDHYLYALDQSSGQVRWRDDIGGENGSSPACADGDVYIGSWRTGDVLAVNAVTGRVLWRYATTSPVASSPFVAGGVVYVGSDSTRMYALKAATGRPIWYKHLDGEITARPYVAGGTVYVGSHGGEVYAINASNGHILWQRRTGGAIDASGPAVAHGIVYIGSDDHRLYALDQATGAIRWTFPADGPVESAPAVADGTVYFGSEDSKFYAVNARSGKRRWLYVTGGYVDSSPVAAHGDVFFGSDDGKVYALNVDGAFMWSHATRGKVESAPAAPATANTVYAGSDDGTIYALKSADGR